MVQTAKEAGYTFLYKNNDSYYFYNNDTWQIELFSKKQDIATWGLIYNHAKLEFCSTVSGEEKERIIKHFKKIINFGEQHLYFKDARKILLTLNRY